MTTPRTTWIPHKIHFKTTMHSHALVLLASHEKVPNDINHIYVVGDSEMLMVIHHGVPLKEITDSTEINKIMRFFSSKTITRNHQNFDSLIEVIALSNEEFHYGVTYEMTTKNFYYYEKLPGKYSLESKKVSDPLKLEFVLNNAPQIQQEFKTEMEGDIYHYTFANRYQVNTTFHGTEYCIQYHYDIYKKDFSRERMGFKTLDFSNEENAQAFLEGVSESNLTKVLESLPPDTTHEIRNFFQYLESSTLASQSLFRKNKKEEDKIFQSLHQMRSFSFN